MQSPYQSPASEPPLAPVEDKPRSSKEGPTARLVAALSLALGVGFFAFLVRGESFHELASKVPGDGMPAFIREAVSTMSEDRVPFAVMPIALLTILISFTRLTRAALVLAYATAAFIVLVAGLGLYLWLKASPYQ